MYQAACLTIPWIKMGYFFYLFTFLFVMSEVSMFFVSYYDYTLNETRMYTILYLIITHYDYTYSSNLEKNYHINHLTLTLAMVFTFYMYAYTVHGIICLLRRYCPSFDMLIIYKTYANFSSEAMSQGFSRYFLWADRLKIPNCMSVAPILVTKSSWSERLAVF